MKYEASGYKDVGGAQLEIEAARFVEVKRAKDACLFVLDVEEKFG